MNPLGHMLKYRALVTIALSCLLTACPRVARPPAGEKPALPPAPFVDLRGAVVYDVNPQASEMHILIYRGGTLARLGHNHVMTAGSLSGRVWVNAAVERSGFELAFPVAQLIVDDPEARRAAGSEFPPEIPQADRDGTRRNMLKAEVLDAEQYPQITLQSVRVSGTSQAPQVTARIRIKGTSRDIPVSAKVQSQDSRLTATGEFDIQQTDFGIKPFSAALGALEVQDRLHVKFSIAADRVTEGNPASSRDNAVRP